MDDRLRLLVLSAALLGTPACKGCGDEPAEKPPRADRLTRVENARVRVLDRLAARKIDERKKYPTDASGVTQCGSEIDCFVLAAERCAPATVEHAQTVEMLGVGQRVEARYTVLGSSAEGCRVSREVRRLEVTLHPKLVEALRAKGKSEADIAKIKTDGHAQLVARNPSRATCTFDGEAALEAALDLAEGKYDPARWRSSCVAEATAQPAAP